MPFDKRLLENPDPITSTHERVAQARAKGRALDETNGNGWRGRRFYIAIVVLVVAVAGLLVWWSSHEKEVWLRENLEVAQGKRISKLKLKTTDPKTKDGTDSSKH